MTSSGTTAFDPSVGDLVMAAYGRCQVKRTALTPEHMFDARMAANLLLAEWENIQPNLWTVDLYPFALTQAISNYVLPATTVAPLDVYISTTLAGQVTDRLVSPISRSDYAGYPNKDDQGLPTVYWFNRQIIPEVTFYQTPDSNGPYTVKMWRLRQIQDANPTRGQTLDAPRRFLPAFAAGLAARLAETYAPQMVDVLEARYQKRKAEATFQDQENVPLTVAPSMGSYFR